MPTLRCYEEGGKAHTWEARGLDTNSGGVLVNVRSCLRCPVEQEKAYGAGGDRPWRKRQATSESV